MCCQFSFHLNNESLTGNLPRISATELPTGNLTATMGLSAEQKEDEETLDSPEEQSFRAEVELQDVINLQEGS